MATKTKSERAEYVGYVESAEIKTRAPFDPYIGRYSPNTEFLEFYLKVMVRTEKETIYFNTPGIIRRVTSCPGSAIVTYSWKGAEKTDGWLKEAGDDAIATPGKCNNNSLAMCLTPGETVRFVGTVKSRNGGTLVLNRVKRIEE